MTDNRETPVYLQLVDKLRMGFRALDLSVQKEIKTFITSRQHQNGGFTDRAGQPDIYYSLFGLWLSLATGQRDLQENLKTFVSGKNTTSVKNPVEKMALILIQSALMDDSQKESLISIFKIIWNNKGTMELSYRFFIVALVIDAVGKNKGIFYFPARIWLKFYKPGKNIPCSVLAALIYAGKILDLNPRINVKKLTNLVLNNSGFKAFDSTKNADTLSTGVALFALQEINEDLRMIAPGCLDFIQANYSDGAFLSGDGDMTKDLEYTFYGLLALGSLVNP